MKTTTVYILAVSWAVVSCLTFYLGRATVETGPEFVEVCTDQERVLVETAGGFQYKYIQGACLEWTLIDVHSAEIADITTYTRVN